MSSRNRHSQELREQAVTQDTLPSKIQPLKIVVEKFVSRCEHYVIRCREDIYPATHIITDCMQLPQQTKKRLRNKILSHIINVQSVSDDVSWQDKISLYQFDNYLSQVKINRATVNNSCFLRYSRYLASSSSFSWQCQVTLSA